MVVSLITCIHSLLWATLLVFMIVYVAGIYITETATTYRATPGSDAEVVEALEGFFGSLILSMFFLFQSISGGESWGVLTEPLLRLHWWYGVFMALFQCFTLLALLNIVTGIFVEGAIEKAQTDKEAMIQMELEGEQGRLQQLTEVFKEIDEDQSGYIDLNEFERLMNDARVKAYFRTMGLHISTAYHLFRLLDLDNSRTVSTSEFLMGCLRLQGNAKSVDVATLMYENKRMMMKWVAFMDYVQEQFNRLQFLLSEGADTDDHTTGCFVSSSDQENGKGCKEQAAGDLPSCPAQTLENKSFWRSTIACASSLNVYEGAENYGKSGSARSRAVTT